MDDNGINEAKCVKTKGIVIGIASSGRSCPIEWALSMANQVYPVNTNIAWIHVVGESVDAARERIVEEALKINGKYLWFVDDDTVPPYDAARKLMFLLDQENAIDSSVKVAGGIYCVKQDPPTPNVFHGPGEGPFWKWKVDDIFECWGMGTGCMMIDTSIFAKIPRPWFKTSSELNFNETDDLYFCKKVADAGFKIKAHGGILCRHWDMKNGVVYSLPSKSYPFIKEPSSKEMTT